MEEILDFLDEKVKSEIKKYIYDLQDIEEIRLRTNKPIIIKNSKGNSILIHIVSKEELQETFQKICEHSIYSYQKQICEGFITIKGGHRVGITGSCVIENNKIININYISSLNIRIAREKKNVSNSILNYVIDGNDINNTIIASKPGCGKTTILRDLVRKLSTGIEEFNFKGKTCGIIDERGEIAAMYKGIPQNDVGIRTDVIDNITKSLGMKIAIRTMAPQVIVADEIGTEQDIEAINYGICSGVKGIFTAHGSDISDLKRSYSLNKLLDSQVFKKIFFLERRGRIAHVYTLSQNMYKLDDEKL